MTRAAKAVAGSRRRRIAVVTGSRAEYGLLQSTISAIARHPKLELQLIVAGMHLIPKLGRTADAIVRDGWSIAARVPMQRGTDHPLDQAEGLARGMAGIARFLERSKSDIVLVLGDRIEAMAGALAGVTTGRIVAHIHGGDVAPGDFDDSLRHAISKLAHLHFAATEGSKRRLTRMGEDPRRVHCVGPPALDRIRERLRLRRGPRNRTGRALIVQHPCGRPSEIEQMTMSNLLRAVRDANLCGLVIHPNSDRGHSGIVRAIQSAVRREPHRAWEVHVSVDRDQYLDWLMSVDVVVGNSSSGLLEAPLVGTPAVNVGPRQKGRERLGSAVIDCGEDYESIYRAIRRAQTMRREGRDRRMPVRRSRVGEKIAGLLAAVRLDETLRRKSIGY